MKQNLQLQCKDIGPVPSHCQCTWHYPSQSCKSDLINIRMTFSLDFCLFVTFRWRCHTRTALWLSLLDPSQALCKPQSPVECWCQIQTWFIFAFFQSLYLLDAPVVVAHRLPIHHYIPLGHIWAGGANGKQWKIKKVGKCLLFVNKHSPRSAIAAGAETETSSTVNLWPYSWLPCGCCGRCWRGCRCSRQRGLDDCRCCGNCYRCGFCCCCWLSWVWRVSWLTSWKVLPQSYYILYKFKTLSQKWFCGGAIWVGQAPPAPWSKKKKAEESCCCCCCCCAPPPHPLKLIGHRCLDCFYQITSPTDGAMWNCGCTRHSNVKTPVIAFWSFFREHQSEIFGYQACALWKPNVLNFYNLPSKVSVTFIFNKGRFF